MVWTVVTNCIKCLLIDRTAVKIQIGCMLYPVSLVLYDFPYLLFETIYHLLYSYVTFLCII
jgi:hypothetical protein